MNQSDRIAVYWNEKVELNRIIDPLGLAGLRVHQGLFFPGFNTQTQRAYYYSFLPWAWKKIEENRLDSSFIKNLEKLMILSSEHLSLSQSLTTEGINSNTRARSFLEKNDSFSISDFHLLGSGDYQGYGNQRYKTPISNMYIMWGEDSGKKIFTPLAIKIAKSFDKKLDFDFQFLRKEKFSKGDLTKLKNLGVNSLNGNELEKDLLKKVFFGFVTELDDKCDINEEGYSTFMTGEGIKLNFELDVTLTKEDIYQESGEDINFEDKSDKERARERIISRRASLFLLLKIIDSCDIKKAQFEMITSLRNCVLYKQAKINNELKKIDFGELEQIRKYWELYFHNIYFTFCMELLLEKIINLLEKYPFGIKIPDLLKYMDSDKIVNKFRENSLNTKDVETNIGLLKNPKLNSKINEFNLYESLVHSSGTFEEDLYRIILLLILLNSRSRTFDDEQRQFIKIKEENELFTPEKIYQLMKNASLSNFIYLLIEEVMKWHYKTAIMKLRYNNTKAFLFVKENDLIEAYENKFSANRYRDYIWGNMYSILEDIGLIQVKNDVYGLTEEGKKWLSKIK